METGMIIDRQDLYFLLACKGCKSCPSFFEPEDKGSSREILERLYRTGWIENTGKRFRVEKIMARAVEQISGSARTIGMCHGNRKKELVFLYPGETVLAVQEVSRRKHMLRLTFLERCGLKTYLEEQGLLGEDESWEPLPYTAGMGSILPEQITRRSDLEGYPWIRLLALVSESGSERTEKRIGIIRNGFGEEIVLETFPGEKPELEPYTEERFLERLLDEWDEVREKAAKGDKT